MNTQILEIKRGDIYYADLSESQGSEQGGIRPVLVMSNNVGNRYSPTVIVAAITSQSKNYIPTHFRLSAREDVSLKASTVMTEQLRTLDRSRLLEYAGSLSPEEMKTANAALAISVGLAIGYRN